MTSVQFHFWIQVLNPCKSCGYHTLQCQGKEPHSRWRAVTASWLWQRSLLMLRCSRTACAAFWSCYLATLRCVGLQNPANSPTLWRLLRRCWNQLIPIPHMGNNSEHNSLHTVRLQLLQPDAPRRRCCIHHTPDTLVSAEQIKEHKHQ